MMRRNMNKYGSLYKILGLTILIIIVSAIFITPALKSTNKNTVTEKNTNSDILSNIEANDYNGNLIMVDQKDNITVYDFYDEQEGVHYLLFKDVNGGICVTPRYSSTDIENK